MPKKEITWIDEDINFLAKAGLKEDDLKHVREGLGHVMDANHDKKSLSSIRASVKLISLFLAEKI